MPFVLTAGTDLRAHLIIRLIAMPRLLDCLFIIIFNLYRPPRAQHRFAIHCVVE